MDRSSFRVVESTRDFEKRQEFKSKLAQKIKGPQLLETPIIEEKTFNGVSAGGKLVHPSLGEGTLVSVDYGKNEVIINFQDKGDISLVLTQAQAFVHAPIKPLASSKDEAFIGEQIVRDNYNRPDNAYREIDFSPVKSPDFDTNTLPKDGTLNGISPGGILVHPSLGEGTLVSVDHGKNEVILNFGDRGNISLVLSQVQPFVHAPIISSTLKEDAFIGEEITKPEFIRPDVAKREIDFSRAINPNFVSNQVTKDETFNGVAPGGILVHPSLGEGTLVSVDHGKNEVVIDFGDKGKKELVLSQIVSFVHAPIRPTAKEIDDPFIGPQILRDKPILLDVAHRELDFSRVVSADFKEAEKSFMSVGSSVWHPDLGACTVLGYDEKNNSLSLNYSQGQVDMVLSQVRSKLRPIEKAPEHVPMKPLVREPLAERIPVYKSRGDVSVSLPEVFNSWKRNQQFVFLTRSQKLTTDQANDVFSVLDGEKPLFHEVTVSWQTQEETEANVFFLNEPVRVPEKVASFNAFLDKRFWHPDFGECSVSSFDMSSNELILQTSVGLRPFVLDVTVPKLAVMTNHVEHSPKRLGTRVLSTTEPTNKTVENISVSLPEEFVTWKTSDQYIFLTKTSHLTPEQANDIIAFSEGKPVHGKNEYEVIWE